MPTDPQENGTYVLEGRQLPSLCMCSVTDDQHIVLRVDGMPAGARSKPSTKMYIKVSVDDFSGRTKTTITNANPSWDARFTLCVLMLLGTSCRYPPTKQPNENGVYPAI